MARIIQNNISAYAYDAAGDRSRSIGLLRESIILTLILGAFFSIMLGSHTLSVPDEARYSEIPREMVATGDYLTPRLNGVKYFEKPALFYWLQAFSIRLFGLNAWSLHLWTAFFALAGCLTVYAAGRALFGRRAGLLAAGVLATSTLYYALSRTIILDMPVSVFLTGSLLSFLLGMREDDDGKRRWYLWAFYALAALAAMTKGLIGIVVPAMIIGAWIAVTGRWSVLKNMRLLSGGAIFLLIAAPWHILVGRVNPEFFRFYFYHEHFERYLTKVHGRYKPAWFFLPVLAAGFFPWTAFLAQAVRHSLPRSWRELRLQRETVFLLLWAGLVFLFFSASDSKLIPYILPVLPPLALLVGRYLAAAWDRPGLRGLRAGYAALVVLGALLAIALLALPRMRGVNAPLHEVRVHLCALALIIIGTGIAVWVQGRRRTLFQAVHVLMAGTALFLIPANFIFTELDNRPVKDLALELKARLRPGDEVMSYMNYYQDLPVYLERRITVVNWYGELAFGSTVEDTSSWMINEREFQKRWCDPSHTAYLLTDISTYDILRGEKGLPLHPIARNQRTILISNREDTT